ncbi:hypothetical protein J7L05_10140 [bacterium]|nr:hypothetical protein [bacterium]
MSGKILDDSEVELFEKIKQDYLEMSKPSLKALAGKYSVNYKKLRLVSKSKNWNQAREDKNTKSVVNGGSRAVESETSPVSDLNGKQKGGSPFSESETPIKNQVKTLRNDAFELASSAAESLTSKDDWNPKEFDLLVGTFAKIVGVQMKMEGNEDGIDRLFSELTDTEVFLAPSAKSEEGADES